MNWRGPATTNIQISGGADMRNRRSLAVGLTVILALIVSLQSPAFPQAAGVGGAPAPDINPPVTNCNPNTDTFVDTSGEFKPTPIADELLTSGQPCQQRVNTKGLFGDDALANLQRGFDFYSWLTFIAMNSPADGKTTIGRGNRPSATPGPSGRPRQLSAPCRCHAARSASQAGMGQARGPRSMQAVQGHRPDHLPAWGRSVQPAVQDRPADRPGRQLSRCSTF